jgi:hypothetical protein
MHLKNFIHGKLKKNIKSRKNLCEKIQKFIKSFGNRVQKINLGKFKNFQLLKKSLKELTAKFFI